MAPPSSLSPRDLRKLRCAKFWLVATGTFWGISMQLIVYEGAGHPMNQLPNIPWYCSFLLVYAVTWFRGDGSFAKGADLEPVRKHQCEIVAPVGLLDWFGTTGLNVGLILSGSAIFGIIYASVTIWTALFAFCLLKKGLTPLKVVGIALVVVGLVLPALEDNDDGDGDSSGDLVGVGIGLTTAATLFYALEYVWCERAFHRYRIDGTELCFWSGIYGLGITLLWIVFYTIPNWDRLVTQEIAAVGGRPGLIFFLYCVHLINNSVHNASWFVVCELEGGTSTGLLMGVKAAFLFFASAVSFCDEEHPEQCMSTFKLVAVCFVVLGAILYYKEPETAAARVGGSGGAASSPGAVGARRDSLAPGKRRVFWRVTRKAGQTVRNVMLSEFSVDDAARRAVRLGRGASAAMANRRRRAVGRRHGPSSSAAAAALNGVEVLRCSGTTGVSASETTDSSTELSERGRGPRSRSSMSRLARGRRAYGKLVDSVVDEERPRDPELQHPEASDGEGPIAFPAAPMSSPMSFVDDADEFDAVAEAPWPRRFAAHTTEASHSAEGQKLKHPPPVDAHSHSH